MDGSCRFNEGRIGDSDVLGSLNQQHLPSYHIVLDFRPREWKQDLLQTERENVISQIASAILTVRSDLHQSQATEIAANFERYTFENSKDQEQYQQTSHLKLLQIQESRKRQMAVAEARRMNSGAREWKQEMIQAERDSFVSEITSALLLSRSDLSSSHATAIATNFEVLTLHKSKDKEEYQQIFQTKLKEIQESIQRKEMAELEMGWLEIAELESRMARDQALLEGLPQPVIHFSHIIV